MTKGLRHTAVVLFLTAMATAAEATGQHEIVFPEAGALCVGLWLMPKAVWNVRGRQIPLLLTGAALIGWGINLLLPVGFEIRFLLAFCAVVLMLRTVRCNMYPVVSAAMLPVLIDTTSWVYPVSVVVISILLAVGHRWMPQTERVEYCPYGLRHWFWLAAAVALFVAIGFAARMLLPGAWGARVHYCMVPPLVVTMIEFSNRRSGFRKRPWTVWGLIVAAAAVGTAAELWLHRAAGMPTAVGVAVAAVVVLLLFRRYKPFAPAMAITLVPLLLPDGVLPWFPLFAALGAAYFIAAGILTAPANGFAHKDTDNSPDSLQ